MSNRSPSIDAGTRWRIFTGAVGAQFISAAVAIGFVLYVLRLGQSSQTVGDWCAAALLVVSSGFAVPILLFGLAKWASTGVPLSAFDWLSIAVRVGIAFAIGMTFILMFAMLALAWLRTMAE